MIFRIQTNKLLTVFCVEAAGTTRLLTAVLPIATTMTHLTVTTTTVFGWHFPSLKEEADAYC
ncbi:MAG: hypothetical protein ACJAUV_002280 [Flavobacteriales bacterium]|jgi:hypothetical protein